MARRTFNNHTNLGPLNDWLSINFDDAKWKSLPSLQNYGPYGNTVINSGAVVYENGATVMPSPVSLVNIGHTGTAMSPPDVTGTQLRKEDRSMLLKLSNAASFIATENIKLLNDNTRIVVHLGKPEYASEMIDAPTEDTMIMDDEEDFETEYNKSQPFPIVSHRKIRRNAQTKEITWSCAFDSLTMALMACLDLTKAQLPNTDLGMVLDSTKLQDERDLLSNSMMNSLTAVTNDKQIEGYISDIRSGVWEYCTWAEHLTGVLNRTDICPVKSLLMYDAYRYALESVALFSGSLSVFSKESLSPSELVLIKVATLNKNAQMARDQQELSEEESKAQKANHSQNTNDVRNGANYVRSLLDYIKFYYNTIRWGFRGTLMLLSRQQQQQVSPSNGKNVADRSDMDKQAQESEDRDSNRNKRQKLENKSFKVRARHYPPNQQPRPDKNNNNNMVNIQTLMANISKRSVEQNAVILPYLRYNFYHWYAYNLQMEHVMKSLLKVDGRNLNSVKYNGVYYKSVDSSMRRLLPTSIPSRIPTYHMPFDQLSNFGESDPNRKSTKHPDVFEAIQKYCTDAFRSSQYTCHIVGHPKQLQGAPPILNYTMSIMDGIDGSVVTSGTTNPIIMDSRSCPDVLIADLFGIVKSGREKIISATTTTPNNLRVNSTTQHQVYPQYFKLFSRSFEYTHFAKHYDVTTGDINLEENIPVVMGPNMTRLRYFSPLWLDLNLTNVKKRKPCMLRLNAWKRNNDITQDFWVSNTIARQGKGGSGVIQDEISFNGIMTSEFNSKPQNIATAKILQTFLNSFVFSQVFCLTADYNPLSAIYFGPILARSRNPTTNVTSHKEEQRYFTDAGENDMSAGTMAVYVPTAIIFQEDKSHFFTEALFPLEFGSPKTYPWGNGTTMQIDTTAPDFNPFFPLAKTHRWCRYDDRVSYDPDWHVIPKDAALHKDVVKEYDLYKTENKERGDSNAFVPNHPLRPLECNHASMDSISKYYNAAATSLQDLQKDVLQLYKMRQIGSHWYLVLNPKATVAINSIYYTKLDMDPNLLMQPPPTRPKITVVLNRNPNNNITPVTAPLAKPKRGKTNKGKDESESKVIVKTSTLKNAGRGLFARVKVDGPGVYLTWYDGKLLDRKTIEEMTKQDETLASHTRRLNNDWVIDGKPITNAPKVNYKRGLAAFINSNKDPSKNNVSWGVESTKEKSHNVPYMDSSGYYHNERIVVRSSKPINAGEELFIKYLPANAVKAGTFNVQHMVEEKEEEKDEEEKEEEEGYHKDNTSFLHQANPKEPPQSLETQNVLEPVDKLIELRTHYQVDFDGTDKYNLKCGFFALYNLLAFHEQLLSLPESFQLRPNMGVVLLRLQQYITNSPKQMGQVLKHSLMPFLKWFKLAESKLCQALDEELKMYSSGKPPVPYVASDGSLHGSSSSEGASNEDFKELSYAHISWLVQNLPEFKAIKMSEYFFIFNNDVVGLVHQFSKSESVIGAPPKVLLQLENAYLKDTYSPTGERLELTRMGNNTFHPNYLVCLVKHHWILAVYLDGYLFTMNSLYREMNEPSLKLYNEYKAQLYKSWAFSTVISVDTPPPGIYMGIQEELVKENDEESELYNGSLYSDSEDLG